MDYDNGRTEYKGKIINDNMEYEFEIDSIGQIVGWEEEGQTVYFAECYILRKSIPECLNFEPSNSFCPTI